jgi:electron-transferring-flavoprotein dehydrogenase
MADRRPVGCAAGFVNVPRIKGVHNAMGSAMLAAEHAAAALAVGRANDELSEYEDAWRTSSVGVDLHKVRNVKPLLSKCGTVIGVGLGFIDMWTNTLFGFSLFGTLGYERLDRSHA